VNEPEPAEEIVPRILRRYSERPRGWRIMNTPKGEVLVLSSDSAFQLKLIPLNPLEFTGAGIELPESNDVVERIRSSPEFGLRPINETDMQNIANAMGGSEEARRELREVLERTPLSLDDLSASKSSHILQGPVLTRPDLGSLSPDILRMQTELDRRAQKIFRDRHPMRAGMYV